MIIDDQFDDFISIVGDNRRVSDMLTYIVRDNIDGVGTVLWENNLKLLKKVREGNTLSSRDKIRFLLLMKLDFTSPALRYTEEELEAAISDSKKRYIKLDDPVDAIRKFLKTDLDPHNSEDEWISFSRLVKFENIVDLQNVIYCTYDNKRKYKF